MNRFKRPSPSMMVSLLALFIALAGTATAATVLIKSSSQIKDGVITRADLARDLINSSRIEDGAVKLSDINEATRGALDAAGTQAFEAFRAGGPEDVAAGKTATVATLKDLPAGAYAIFGKTNLTAPNNDSGVIGQGNSVGGHCLLDASGDSDESFVLLGTPGALAPGEVSTQLTRTYASSGTVKLTCDVSEQWRASNTSIIALRLSSAPRQTVDG
jgi:hypothetical protein